MHPYITVHWICLKYVLHLHEYIRNNCHGMFFLKILFRLSYKWKEDGWQLTWYVISIAAFPINLRVTADLRSCKKEGWVTVGRFAPKEHLWLTAAPLSDTALAVLWWLAVIGWLRTLPDSPPLVIGSFSSGGEQEAGSLAVHRAEDFLGRHRLVDVRTVLIGQGSFGRLPVHFKISSHRQREMTHCRLTCRSYFRLSTLQHILKAKPLSKFKPADI